jgi:hypothetical protein
VQLVPNCRMSLSKSLWLKWYVNMCPIVCRSFSHHKHCNVRTVHGCNRQRTGSLFIILYGEEKVTHQKRPQRGGERQREREREMSMSL